MIGNNFSKIFELELQLLNPTQNQDIEFWKEMAKKYCKNNVLEIACGSGRISFPLIESGFNFTGFDNSRDMLQIFNQKMESKKIPKKNVSILQADMRNFKIKKKFDFAFIGYFAFQMLTNLEDQLQCLNNINYHLEENGILGLDIYPAICEGNDVKEKEVTHKLQEIFEEP